MMRVTDDLCPATVVTGSTSPSTFTDFDDHGDGDEGDCMEEPPELKYDPVVKTELPEETGNITEEDIDDDFIKRYLGDGGGGDTNVISSPPIRGGCGRRGVGRPPVGTARRGGSRVRGRGRGGGRGRGRPPKTVITTEDLEESESGVVGMSKRRESRKPARLRTEEESSLDDAVFDTADLQDEDWSPDEDEDWAPGKSKKRKTSAKRNTSKRGRGGQAGRRRMTGEEIREKDVKRKRQYRKRVKLQENLEDLVGGDGANVDIKIELEGEGEEDVIPSGRRKKRISDMTPEEQERARAQWRDAHRKKTEKARQVKSEGGGGEDSDASSTRTPRKRRKKRISEMSPEEAERVRARWREQHKKQRARDRELREAFKSEGTEESDASSVRTLGRRKKRIAEMSPEEREEIQARWRQQHERRRARRKNMSVEKIEAEKAKARERQRMRRALAKEGALPEEQLKSIEEQYRKDRERKRARRAKMTAEEKKEEIQKTTMYRLLREARMTEEEKRARQMKMYLARMAKLAEMDPKEREQMEEKMRIRRREAGRRRYEKLKATMGQEGIREMRRNYWHGMSPEQKAKALAKLRECHRRKVEKLKQDPEKWEEVKQRWKERDRVYKQRRRDGDDLMPGQKRSRGAVGGRGRCRSSGSGKKWSELTEEEKEKRRQSRREYVLKRKLAIQKLLDSGMSMEEIQQQTETPEQRERRLIRQRIRKARSNLRARLQSVGATPEEIQQKVEELKHTYQPTHAFRPYKPRPENWRPVDPTEIAKLEAEGKLDNLGEIKPLAKIPKMSPNSQQPQKTPKQPKASSSKSQTPRPPKDPTAPRKRGRPLKYPLSTANLPPPPPVSTTVTSSSSNAVLIFKDEKPSELPPPPTTTTIQIQSYQPVAIAPAEQSNQSTIVSITTIPYQQQFSQYETSYHSTASSTSSPQPVFHYISPQPPPQQQPPQSQTYSLQHILDGIVYHEIGVGGISSTTSTPHSSVLEGQQVTTHYQFQDHSTTSSQHEYGSSYYGDDHSPPPSSPGGGGNFDESFISYTQPPQQINCSSTSEVTTSEQQPKKVKKSRGPRPYVYRPPKNPDAKTRTKRADVIRDVVCDECGQPYNRLSLRAHKNQLHNPNYDVKNRTCLICGEKYKHAQRWYTHYLRDHVRPTQVPSHKSHMCEECGQSFVNKENYKKHQYYIHGDGLKKENHIRCSVCPEEKLFKEKMGYYSHLKRFHPNYVRPGHDCYRCDKSFPNDKVLGEHVGACHPESYFPCPYCTATRFTQLGLNFHYSRCTKITKEERSELKGRCREGVFCLEEMPINCELCEKTVILSSLTRHYKEMHNVKEDKFTCPECRKEFKTRGFWAIHLEEKHRRGVEEMREMLRGLNARDREGISFLPQKSRHSRPSGGGRKARGGGGGRSGGRRKRVNKNDESSAGEEEDEEEEAEWIPDKEEIDKRNRGRKRRNVIVIAEEDELENQILSQIQL